jgi:hypothetical protein
MGTGVREEHIGEDIGTGDGGERLRNERSGTAVASFDYAIDFCRRRAADHVGLGRRDSLWPNAS